MYLKDESSLAYEAYETLLDSANLTNEQKQLVKATVSKMDYQIMKDQLKKFFNSASTNVDDKTDIDKIDVRSKENEVFYKSKNKNYRQYNSYGGSFSRNNQNFKNKNYNKKMNPLNIKGGNFKMQLLWVEISLGKKLSRCRRKI